MQVRYFGCVFDETLSGETMALKALNKMNGKLKFLYHKNKFLTPALRRMLCNARIQPHCDYACSTWYPAENNCLVFPKIGQKISYIQQRV